jgi:hypothetical protein
LCDQICNLASDFLVQEGFVTSHGINCDTEYRNNKEYSFVIVILLWVQFELSASVILSESVIKC